MLGYEIVRDDEKDDAGGYKRDCLDAEFIHKKNNFKASSVD